MALDFLYVIYASRFHRQDGIYKYLDIPSALFTNLVLKLFRIIMIQTWPNFTNLRMIFNIFSIHIKITKSYYLTLNYLLSISTTMTLTQNIIISLQEYYYNQLTGHPFSIWPIYFSTCKLKSSHRFSPTHLLAKGDQTKNPIHFTDSSHT